MKELDARYDARASFYGKAVVETKGTTKTLYSYKVPVCKINTNKHTVKLLTCWDYSQTTVRHVKEFLKQNDFFAKNRKQIAEDYLS